MSTNQRFPTVQEFKSYSILQKKNPKNDQELEQIEPETYEDFFKLVEQNLNQLEITKDDNVVRKCYFILSSDSQVNAQMEYLGNVISLGPGQNVNFSNFEEKESQELHFDQYNFHSNYNKREYPIINKVLDQKDTFLVTIPDTFYNKIELQIIINYIQGFFQQHLLIVMVNQLDQVKKKLKPKEKQDIKDNFLKLQKFFPSIENNQNQQLAVIISVYDKDDEEGLQIQKQEFSSIYSTEVCENFNKITSKETKTVITQDEYESLFSGLTQLQFQEKLDFSIENLQNDQKIEINENVANKLKSIQNQFCQINKDSFKELTQDFEQKKLLFQNLDCLVENLKKLVNLNQQELFITFLQIFELLESLQIISNFESLFFDLFPLLYMQQCLQNDLSILDIKIFNDSIKNVKSILIEFLQIEDNQLMKYLKQLNEQINKPEYPENFLSIRQMYEYFDNLKIIEEQLSQEEYGLITEQCDFGTYNYQELKDLQEKYLKQTYQSKNYKKQIYDNFEKQVYKKQINQIKINLEENDISSESIDYAQLMYNDFILLIQDENDQFDQKCNILSFLIGLAKDGDIKYEKMPKELQNTISVCQELKSTLLKNSFDNLDVYRQISFGGNPNYSVFKQVKSVLPKNKIQIFKQICLKLASHYENQDQYELAAENYKLTGNETKVKENYKKIIDYLTDQDKQKKFQKELASICLKLGNTYLYEYNIYQALETFQKSKDILKQLKETDTNQLLSYVYTRISLCFSLDTYKKTKAIKKLKSKALKLDENNKEAQSLLEQIEANKNPLEIYEY